MQYKKIAVKAVTLVIFFLFTVFNIVEGKQEAQIRVTVENGLISVECKEAKIEDLISTISKKSNIDYKIEPDMMGKIITVKFRAFTLRETVEKILKENYAIVYDNGNPEKVKKLYVINKAKGNEKFALIEALNKDIFLELKALKTILTRNVLREHLNAQFYEVIPHYDLNGRLVSYVFTYFLGRGQVPDRKTLDEAIRKAWHEKKGALEDIHNGYIERDSAKISEAAALSKRASLNMTRENDFLTLEVGASYEVPPIIAFWNGLPLDISQYPRALDVVNEKLKEKNLTFKSTYSTGLFSIVYAFEGDDKKTYYIEPKSRKIFTSWEQIKKGEDESVKKRRTAISEKNRLKWAKFLGI